MAYVGKEPIPVVAGGSGVATLTTAYAPVCAGTTATGSLQAASTGMSNSGYVFTSTGSSSLPTWQAASGGGIGTIDGNSGSVTGSTVTVTASDGSSKFTGSGATLTQTFTTTDAKYNTFVGSRTFGSVTGGQNTGFGDYALHSLTSGNYNTAVGQGCAGTIQTGAQNSCFGVQAGGNGLNNGNGNVLLGYNAWYNYTGAESWNVLVGASSGGSGTPGESFTCRIGNGTGNSAGNLNQTFISGIQTIVVTGTPVLVSTGDQLGVAASSNKFKTNIASMQDTTSLVMSLRPVNFNWDPTKIKDSTDEMQYGLIAEETAEVFPYLVVNDKQGNPISVKYNELPAILLNEIQKLRREVDQLQAKLAG